MLLNWAGVSKLWLMTMGILTRWAHLLPHPPCRSNLRRHRQLLRSPQAVNIDIFGKVGCIKLNTTAINGSVATSRYSSCPISPSPYSHTIMTNTVRRQIVTQPNATTLSYKAQRSMHGWANACCTKILMMMMMMIICCIKLLL